MTVEEEKQKYEKSLNQAESMRVQGVCDEQEHSELMLWSSRWEENEKSISQASAGIKCDKDQMEQMVTPVNITLVMSYQPLANNPEVKQTDEINSLDLQQGWGKAVSFITNSSNKLRLSSVFRSLAHIPVVTKNGKVEENSTVEVNDLNNVNYISETNSSFTFFL